MKLKRSPIKRKWKEHVKEDIEKMFSFFMSIWRKRPHKSEVSGERISSPSSLNFHHIILKENCEEGKYDEENIIILTVDEHGNVHNDKFRYPEINKRREILKKKYSL